MRSFDKILVPTDFSKASEAGLEAAVSLAKELGASIVLMHAYQVPVYAYPSAPLAPLDELSLQIQTIATASLERSARAYRGVVPITTALYVGAPWEQILEAAREHGADLIVVGSRGLRGLPRALLGSTAERVVRHASVAVLTVHERPDEKNTAAPRP